MLRARCLSRHLRFHGSRHLCKYARHLHSSLAASDQVKPYYVTTPIFYVNAEPHIGHLHSLVLADVLKRFRHLRYGEREPKPTLLTGTDEHGMKIQKSAESQNLAPQDLCDRVSQRFQALASAANVDYDIFYRTTAPQHVQVVQDIWLELKRKGLIYKAAYEGWYSVSDEAYYTDSQIREEHGPNGPYKVAIETSQPVEWTQEENYMFRLSQFQQPLIEWLKDNPSSVTPTVRYNEVLSYLEAGQMGDLSISRPRSRLQWGIEVPDDPSHTIYVWMDALLNYLSYTGYPNRHAQLWPADVHVIGKDIIRFHAVYWPAILMALGLPLPRHILAHAHWTMGNFKMSKSRGNVVNPFEAIQTYTIDGIRFFLMYRGGLSSDSDFAPEHVERDYRKFLVGQTGNLLQRLLSKTMIRKMQTALPSFEEDRSNLAKTDASIRETYLRLPDLYSDRMEALNPSSAIEAVLECLGQINAFVAEREPWKIDDPAELATVMSTAIEGLRRAATLLYPFIPEASSHILSSLGHKGPPTWADAEDDKFATGIRRILDGKHTRQPVFPPLIVQ